MIRLDRPAAALAGLLVMATGFALPAAAETTYGEPLSDLEPVRIGELTGNPESFVDRRIKVVGLVNDICPMKGCWVDIVEEQSSETIRLKVQDDVIVFPAEARGQEIVAEGTLRRHEMSPQQAVRWLRHLAEERGEEYEEPDNPQPLTFYQIEGIGAVLQNAAGL